MVATIDLGEGMLVKTVTTGCLQDTRSWIFMPTSVSIYGSKDGKFFTFLGKADNSVDQRATGSVKKDFKVSFSMQNFRYIRAIADNIEVCPDWHNGKGQGAYLFVDEIIVE
jgi:hexosaminidase